MGWRRTNIEKHSSKPFPLSYFILTKVNLDTHKRKHASGCLHEGKFERGVHLELEYSRQGKVKQHSLQLRYSKSIFFFKLTLGPHYIWFAHKSVLIGTVLTFGTDVLLSLQFVFSLRLCNQCF